MRMNRLAWLALLLAACLLLSSCRKQAQNVQVSPEVPLPEPEEPADEMFLGERSSASRHDLTLYYIAADGMSLSPVSRTFYAENRTTLARSAVQALFVSPGSGTMLAVAPGETQLLSAECAGNTCTVNLSVDARNVQSDQELYLMYAAISATLLGIDGVDGVNVLIGGQSESVYRLPVGVFCEGSEAVVGALAQLQAESDRFLNGDSTARGALTRRALVYYPSLSGGMLLPELREVSFEEQNYARVLMEALQEAPERGGSSVSPLTPGLDSLAEAPNSYISEQGMRLLDLRLTALADAYLESAGLTRDQLCAALTLTMCSFVPELDGVRVSIADELIDQVEIAGETYILPDGVQTRQLWAGSVGSGMTLYFTGEAGGLAAEERIVPQACADSPLNMLEALFDGPVAGESHRSALPEGVSALDVLGVSVQDGVARVNLSGNFYRRCQTLDEQAERNAVYAIVNTLCGLVGVHGVELCIEGSAARQLTSSISLRSTLLFNPGIVETEEE